ncbi:MAG: DUF2062 domain-containing protein [Nanoarchaeota archaeon]|nr:DUF2062 domain-containing protein [Nanoarchaeota archaeon]MBU1974790.1 DUF2062 domain-containing protein [Nanoarchaeota archaeon]
MAAKVKKLKDRIKNHFQQVLRIKTSPHAIAMGFAVGTFINIFPTPGFGMLIGLLVIIIFKKINKIALLLAFAIFNPIFMIPIHYASYLIGDTILNPLPLIEYKVVFFQQVYNLTRRLFIGNIILSIPISTISYFIVKSIVKKYQETNK